MPSPESRDNLPAWQLKSADPHAAALLATHLACPPAIAQILTTRNILTPTSAEAFLNPHIDQLHAPDQLLAMPEAVTRILTAIQNQEPILIYGDYDVDGTTATVLLKTTIERIALALQKTATVTYHVPHRIREGYGMQANVLGLAATSGVRLVISVDTGIRAFAAADEARTLGLDLIVTDHHLPDEIGIPDALAVINPNQPNCPYPNKSLCGAAVAFKLAHALLLAAAPLTPDPAAFNTRTQNILLPSFLKLVAIATIADSVPLTGENRTITALGLAALANPIQPGLRALMQIAKIPLDRPPTATEVGFRLAPRINAAGRMDIAGDVVELFLTRDPARAQLLAEKLDTLNHARRTTEATALDAIETELLTLLTPELTYPANVLILDHAEWHRGVLGILASRVVDRTGRPALILTHAGGDAHGSGRSIPGFHLLDALTAIHTATTLATNLGAPCLAPETWEGPPQNPPLGAPGLASETWVEPPQNPTEATPLFHRFGGHAHAVGFSLPTSALPELRARMSTYAAQFLTAPLLIPTLDYDAELTLAEITPNLYTWTTRLAPFGQHNPEPIFLTRNATLSAPIRLIQEKHICLQLIQPAPQMESAPQPSKTISALGWSRASSETWATRCAHLTPGSAIDLLYRLKQNTSPYANGDFNGLELELCDIRPASGPAPA